LLFAIVNSLGHPASPMPCKSKTLKIKREKQY